MTPSSRAGLSTLRNVAISMLWVEAERSGRRLASPSRKSWYVADEPPIVVVQEELRHSDVVCVPLTALYDGCAVVWTLSLSSDRSALTRP